MSAEPADRPVLDPDAVAGKAFAHARKGYEPDEVRAFLVGLSSQIRESEQSRQDMERRVAELERRAQDPKDLDEGAVIALLGEETTRVLMASRQAAAEIRAKAEDETVALLAAATEEADSARQAADQYAASVRAEADEAQGRVRGEADAYATELRATAVSETEAQRAAADEYAAAVRDRADAEVAEQQARSTVEVEELRAAAESVLADRTAEAEVAANSIRTDVETQARHTREEADRYAESTRSAADAYRADTQSGADAYRETATSEADRLRGEAQVVADSARAAAEAEAVARRAEVDHEVETLLADAREQGRAMVGEARTYRERVIADLADRRRAARTQLEQLATTRDALAVTLSDVAARVEQSHRSLQDAVIDAREVGDASVDRAALAEVEPPPPATSLAVGEVDGPPAVATEPVADVDAPDGPDVLEDGDLEALTEGPEDRGDGAPDGTSPESGSEPEPAEPEPEPEAEPGAGGIDAEQVGDDEVGLAAAVVDTAADVEVETDASVASAPSSGPATDTASSDPDDDGVGSPGIEDLFARIREERAVTGPAGGDGPDAGASPTDPLAAEVVVEPKTISPEAFAEGDEGGTLDPDHELLERRDATTDELERQLARRLKRVLSDEQNEVLDLLRRTRGNPGAAEVLPSEAEHLARYAAAALEDLRGAERAGAAFYGDAPAEVAEVADTAETFAGELVRQIRVRLERAFEEGGDENEVGDRIRACYREWKTQRIADTARHYVVVAFSRGVAGAATPGTSFRWLVDDGEVPSPDCEDNALAGAVAAGEPFPTGDLYPPAHPGCRCLLVLVE